jgi:DNA-binding NtrC family response regulator
MAEDRRIFVIAGQDRNRDRAVEVRIARTFRRRESVLRLRLIAAIPMTTVLFVSHDSDLRAAASRVLTMAGCRVTAAAHAGHASLACAEGTFDVLVIERRMADGSSRAVAERFQRARPEANIVWVGDSETGGTADDQLARPFNAYDLISAVSNASHYVRRGARTR